MRNIQVSPAALLARKFRERGIGRGATMMTQASRLCQLVAALFCWIAAAGPALSADPLARAALQSGGNALCGQQILIDVDVLVPNYFLQPPQFPAIDLPGAIVTLDDGGRSTQRKRSTGPLTPAFAAPICLTAQSSGDFTLPPAVITFGYAAVPPQATRGEVTLHRFASPFGKHPRCRRTSRCGRRKGQHQPGTRPGSGSSEGGGHSGPDDRVRAVGFAHDDPRAGFFSPDGVRLYGRIPHFRKKRTATASQLRVSARMLQAISSGSPAPMSCPRCPELVRPGLRGERNRKRTRRKRDRCSRGLPLPRPSRLRRPSRKRPPSTGCIWL